jgi:hypothetical protein
VTDNATNNDTLCCNIADNFTKFSPAEHRVRCIAHIMHLAVTAFLLALDSSPPELEDVDTVAEAGTINKVCKFYYYFACLR